MLRAGLPDLDRRTAEHFIRAWERAFDEGDYRRMAAFYTRDARLIGTNMETVDGRHDIEAFWQTACEGGRAAGLRRVIDLDEVRVSGDLGYMRGTVFLSRAGSDVSTRVRYVTLWRREEDAVWRLSVDISSAAPASTMARR